MKTQLIYRLGEERDIPQLNELGQLSYGEFKTVLTQENWNKLNGHLSNVEETKSAFYSGTTYICEAEDQVVGMIYLIPNGNPTELYDKAWSYIRFLGVHPEYQGRGIARQLTNLCLLEARKTGEKTIALHTSEMMVKAQNLYASLGFVKHWEFEQFGKRYWIFLKSLG
ncbi:MAG: GNAT family N-acetyltransferase [Crocinitomicaceae bacterium]|nr:GNAT family N-acetyltransferase [Crocinitomicaceae bacterium]|tara:strand:- start:4384 stop:4887 length:504 start_codon:yes stop_codon:yes gene_type:complete